MRGAAGGEPHNVVKRRILSASSSRTKVIVTMLFCFLPLLLLVSRSGVLFFNADDDDAEDDTNNKAKTEKGGGDGMRSAHRIVEHFRVEKENSAVGIAATTSPATVRSTTLSADIIETAHFIRADDNDGNAEPVSSKENNEEAKSSETVRVIKRSGGDKGQEANTTTTSTTLFPPLPPNLPYWPRPFGINRFTLRTPAGQFLQSLLGQENSGGAAITADGDGGFNTADETIPPRRWVFRKDISTEHYPPQQQKEEKKGEGEGEGVGETEEGGGDASPRWRSVLTQTHGIALTPELDAAIANLAKSFDAYDANPNDEKAQPAYATICGHLDCGFIAGHFKSLTAVGRFILIVNTELPTHVGLFSALSEAFPQRFVADMAMMRTLELFAGQAEYMRRHGGSNGIDDDKDEDDDALTSTAVAAEEGSDSKNKSGNSSSALRRRNKNTNGSRHNKTVSSSMASPRQKEVEDEEEDARDDALDAVPGAVSTRMYRSYLRQMPPALLVVPLSRFHSVALGWNRILNYCFRGPHPIDYVFIANGDFFLLDGDLPKFAAYAHAKTSAALSYMRANSNKSNNKSNSSGNTTTAASAMVAAGAAEAGVIGYHKQRRYSFFAYSYVAWQRLGEFDETCFPMYQEDSEMRQRIQSADLLPAPLFCDTYENSRRKCTFAHRISTSLDKKNPELMTFFASITKRSVHWKYLGEKYKIKRLRKLSVPLSLSPPSTSDPPPPPPPPPNYFLAPFNDTSVPHRHSWAIDVPYRKCLLSLRMDCQIRSDRIRTILLGGEEGEQGAATAAAADERGRSRVSRQRKGTL